MRKSTTTSKMCMKLDAALVVSLFLSFYVDGLLRKVYNQRVDIALFIIIAHWKLWGFFCVTKQKNASKNVPNYT